MTNDKLMTNIKTQNPNEIQIPNYLIKDGFFSFICYLGLDNLFVI